jgi:hypothetical protein
LTPNLTSAEKEEIDQALKNAKDATKTLITEGEESLNMNKGGGDRSDDDDDDH